MIHFIAAAVIAAISAGRTDAPPVIDGSLDDMCWDPVVPVVEEFICFRPLTDSPMSQPTSMLVLYDESHIYFGCFMHDPEPHRINHQAGARDEDAPVDKIYIYLDTFDDDANCYVFVVTVDGTQLDSRRTAIGGDDMNWDAVWDSAVRITDTGWVAELAIPFSAMRYSPETDQVWGINFGRTISYTNEAGYLYRMREQGGTDVSLFGQLDGLADLPSGHGVEFRPFVAGRMRFTGGADLFDDPWGIAGADVKVPLGMQTVMDLSVLPDFGQVESDADQGNISHWAPWLQEKRPFFMEAAEVFQMPFDMFYSRNIGSVASNGELIQILGGTKITGTSGGIRYGALGAVTERIMEADTAMLEPASSWFAGSVLNEFSMDNWIKFSATSVDAPAQEGAEYDYSRSASLTGKAVPWQDIHLQGQLGLTWNRLQDTADNTALQLDAGYFPERFELNFRYKRIGEDFDQGRMGYFQGSGEEIWSGYSSLSIEVDRGLVDNVWMGLNPWYSRDLEGRDAGSGIHGWAGGVTPNRYDLNLWFDHVGRWFDRYEGPDGRWYPGGLSGGGSASTDYRNPVAGWISLNRNAYLDASTRRYSCGLRLKPVPELFISLEPAVRLQDPATRYNWDSEQWESTDSDWRSLTLSATWFLNSRMRLRFNGQVSRFERNWETPESSGVSENLWGNVLYSWEYAPGSWFHFLAGEVQYEEEDPVFTVYAKLMRYF